MGLDHDGYQRRRPHHRRLRGYNHKQQDRHPRLSVEARVMEDAGLKEVGNIGKNSRVANPHLLDNKT